MCAPLQGNKHHDTLNGTIGKAATAKKQVHVLKLCVGCHKPRHLPAMASVAADWDSTSTMCSAAHAGPHL